MVTLRDSWSFGQRCWLENTCESEEGTREESEVRMKVLRLANRKKLD
jgi:hypothetical protein